MAQPTSTPRFWTVTVVVAPVLLVLLPAGGRRSAVSVAADDGGELRLGGLLDRRRRRRLGQRRGGRRRGGPGWWRSSWWPGSSRRRGGRGGRGRRRDRAVGATGPATVQVVDVSGPTLPAASVWRSFTVCWPRAEAGQRQRRGRRLPGAAVELVLERRAVLAGELEGPGGRGVGVGRLGGDRRGGRQGRVDRERGRGVGADVAGVVDLVDVDRVLAVEQGAGDEGRGAHGPAAAVDAALERAAGLGAGEVDLRGVDAGRRGRGAGQRRSERCRGVGRGDGAGHLRGDGAAEPEAWTSTRIVEPRSSAVRL